MKLNVSASFCGEIDSGEKMLAVIHDHGFLVSILEKQVEYNTTNNNSTRFIALGF